MAKNPALEQFMADYERDPSCLPEEAVVFLGNAVFHDLLGRFSRCDINLSAVSDGLQLASYLYGLGSKMDLVACLSNFTSDNAFQEAIGGLLVCSPFNPSNIQYVSSDSGLATRIIDKPVWVFIDPAIPGIKPHPNWNSKVTLYSTKAISVGAA